MYPQQNNSSSNNQSAYDFIINPQQPQNKKLFGGSSIAVRTGLVCGVILIVLILFVAIRGLIFGSQSNTVAVSNVMSQQQELVRISSTALRSKQPLNDSSRNAATTIELSINSQRSELLAYAKTQGVKINTKKLISSDKKVNDDQLAAAIAAGTYDATLMTVLNAQLTAYQQDLKIAFNKTDGAKGRELLNKQYQAANLLQKQLGTGL